MIKLKNILLMKITENIRKKYNKLFKKVAKYYHLDHKITTSAANQLHYIRIQEFGYRETRAITTSLDNADTIFAHLKENFTYLAPFYKFFHQDHFCQPGLPDSIISLLKDINIAIIIIRKEKNKVE